MRTVRVYRDGSPSESAIEGRGHNAAAALRNAAKRLGLRGVCLHVLERPSTRHRVVEWSGGVRLHVLEEARAGTTRNTEGLRLVRAWLSPEATQRGEALVDRLGSWRAALEWALTQAPDPGVRAAE